MRTKSVIVVGGGIAGLAAAHELLQAGCRVTLLEAKGSLGGRIHTNYEQGFPIELGAEFLHGKTRVFDALLNEANLPLEPGPTLNRVLLDGQLTPADIWGKATEVLQQADLFGRDLPCAEFLAGLPLSPEDRQQVAQLIEGFHAAPAASLSTHALRRADYSAQQMDGEKQFRIKRGYGALVQYLEARVRASQCDVRLNSPVREIEWRAGRVNIRAVQDNFLEQHQGDAAVIALPLGVLKQGAIEFHPGLHAKDEAIHGLGISTVVKVMLMFKERWWGEADIGLVHSYEEPLPTWWSSPRGAMLTGWAGGPKAEELAGLGAGRLERMALDSLSRIFDCQRSTLQDLLVRSFFHDWMNDPLIRGAYSYVPVNGLDLPKLLAEPLRETLYFAGEAAVMDAQTGMVFNAYESGVRAAKSLLGEACPQLQH